MQQISHTGPACLRACLLLLLLLCRVPTVSPPLAVRRSPRPPQAAGTHGPCLATAARRGSVMAAIATSAETAPAQVGTPTSSPQGQHSAAGHQTGRELLVRQHSRLLRSTRHESAAGDQLQEPLTLCASLCSHTATTWCTAAACRWLEHVQRHGQVTQPHLPRPGWRELGPVPPRQPIQAGHVRPGHQQVSSSVCRQHSVLAGATTLSFTLPPHCTGLRSTCVYLCSMLTVVCCAAASPTCRYFDYAMFFLIMLNCIAMAYEYPAMSKDDLDGQILFWR